MESHPSLSQVPSRKLGGLAGVLGSGAWAAAFCALVSVVVYLPVIGASFVRWDDNWLIYENPRLRGLTLTSLRDVFLNARPSSTWYTPLTGLRYNFITHFFGLDPRAFHVVNLLVHAINAALVVWLLRTLLAFCRRSSHSPVDAVRENLAATTAALLWALHPLRVETVAWVSGAAHEQALLFLLLAFIAHLHAVRAKGRRRIASEALAALAYLASVLSQPMGLGFPGVVLAFDYWESRRTGGANEGERLSRLLRQCAPFIGLGAALLILNVALHFQSPLGGHQPVSLAACGVYPRLAQASYLLVYFVWRPFVPFGLSPVYSQLIDFKPWSFPFVASGLAVVGLAAVVVVQSVRGRWTGFCALVSSYFFLLAPMLGWTDHPYYPNDRYATAAAIAGSVAIAVFLSGAQPMRRRMAAGLLTAVVTLTLIPLTLRQCGIWKDSETLFHSIIATLGDDPVRAEIHWRLGLEIENQQRFQESARHYAETLLLRPGHPIAAPGLLRSCGEGGRRSQSEATRCYQQFLARASTAAATGPELPDRTAGLQDTPVEEADLNQLRDWFSRSGYFFILGLFGCCATALGLAWRESWSREGGLRVPDWQGAVMAVVIAILTFALVPHRHRVLNDELQLLSVARSMTLHQETRMEREVWTHNPDFKLEFWIDKRPLVFPFLISAAHTTTGYRLGNVFALNALLLAAFLLALHTLLRRYLSRTSCAAALLLVAAQPIVLLCATAGGYEICYLLFLTLGFLGLRYFLDAPSTARLQLLVFLLLLLANVQYTAATMLLLALGGIAVLGFLRWRFLTELSLLPLAPLFLLPVAWQRLIMLQTPDPSFPAGSTASAFGWRYLAHNVAILPQHFFSLTASSALAGAVNIAGVLALAGLAVWLFRRGNTLTRESRALLLILASFLGVTLTILLFYYSGLDGHWMNARLYLPFAVLLSISPVFFGHVLLHGHRWRDVIIVAAAAIALVVYAPLARADPLFRTGQFTQELDFLARYWEAHPLTNSLVIYKMSQELAPFRTDAINMKTARRWRDLVVAQRDQGVYERIYVVQSVDCRSGAAFPLDVFDPRLPLTKFAETTTIPGMCLRISLLQ